MSIQIVGWAGRAVKGGKGIYSAAKGISAAEQAMSTYKNVQAFTALEKTEMGIYGLLSANGLSEYVTGKDMFGNELTDQQRQASLTQSIFAGLPFVPGMAKEANRLGQQALNSTVQIGKQGADVSRAFMDDLGQSLNTVPNAAFAGGVGNMGSYLKAESRADVGKVSGDKTEYWSMLSGRGSGVEDSVNGEKDNYFIGTLKGKEIHLKGVKLEEIIYTKRFPEETAKLRKEFNSSVRKKFLKEFANDPIRVEYLKEAGLGAVDIARMQDGLNPKGWQVHHNLPLDDGGTNDFANLVLINNDPYHKAVTNEQNSLTRGLAPKQSITINWPMFKDEIYPPKPFERREE